MERDINDVSRIHLAVALGARIREQGIDSVCEGQIYLATIQDAEGRRMATWPLIVTPQELEVACFLAEGNLGRA